MKGVFGLVHIHQVLHVELYHLHVGGGVDPPQQQSTWVLRGRLSHTELHIMHNVVPFRQHSGGSCQNDRRRNKVSVQ